MLGVQVILMNTKYTAVIIDKHCTRAQEEPFKEHICYTTT